MIIAIDGPAGSGKSTVARRVAERLGFLYLDTGAIYRALTLRVIEKKISPDDDCRIIAEAKAVEIEFRQGKVFLDGIDVTESIRHPRVDRCISRVAGIPEVRAELVRLQQQMGSRSDCVVEGRDTTTVVFPEAELKIYLDALLGERTRRRMGDFKAKQIAVDAPTLEQDLKRRDDADISRAIGALRKAEDAVYIDTTEFSIEQVVEKVCALIT
ncbi:(d)CMP kinase [Candidatus Omnitrophota bacterium]